MATSQGPIGGWYSSLKASDKPSSGRRRALFVDIPRSSASNYFLTYAMRDGFRKYAAFRSSVDFYLYYQKLYEREFHEVILGEKPQKPRFDIDLTPELVKGSGLNSCKDFMAYGNAIRDEILVRSREVLEEYGLELHLETDVVVCISHSLDLYINENVSEKTKYSCHVIFSKYMHYNYEEAAEFFKLVVAKSPKLQNMVDKGILDKGIFGSLKSFRVIGSTKEGVRVKTFVSSFDFQGRSISKTAPKTSKENMILFRQTCITDTCGCVHIPVIVPIKEEKFSSFVLPVGTSDQALDLLKAFEGDDLPFAVASVSGGLVLLNRLRPSHCRLCQRSHEAENPYLRVSQSGNVYFYCRRAPEKNNSYRIGTLLGLNIPSPEEESGTSSESGEQQVSRGTSWSQVRQNPFQRNVEATSSGPSTPYVAPSNVSTAPRVTPRVTPCNFRELSALSRQFAPRGGLPQSSNGPLQTQRSPNTTWRSDTRHEM